MSELGPTNPLLSVVIAIVSDTTGSRCDVSHLAGSLTALAQQLDPPPMEILVPYHPEVAGIEELRQRFPNVVFLPVNDLRTFTGLGGSREHHDELRARGLAAARGALVALIEDHGRPDPRWCAQIVAAHRHGYAAIGGAIENGIDRPLNWAVYFCDFGKYQNPVRAGESAFASDANICYKRAALEAIRTVWMESFHEPAVNAALLSRGEKLVLSLEIIVYQHRGNLTLGRALKERYIWGRSYAATRSRQLGARRLIYAALSPVLPAVMLMRMALNVIQKRRLIGAFLTALPLIALLSVSWSWGECMGYVSGYTTKGMKRLVRLQ